jgi:hypothetical protein
VPWTEIISLIGVGLATGALGGLLGIGGSIIMIPVLTLVFGHDQHLSQASAMIVNVFVSAPAAIRHHRAGAVDWPVVRRMLPAGLVLIIVGVEVSNRLDHALLMRVFGAFLIYVIYQNVRKLVDGRQTTGEGPDQRTWTRSSAVGGIMGFMAGLLGIGGGIIAVPLLQRITHLPLRRCIGVSATAMCVTATIGAVRKNMNLEAVVAEPTTTLDPLVLSLAIAACFAPTAIVGGFLGAGLTHSIPLKVVRFALIILLCIACVKFLGIV